MNKYGAEGLANHFGVDVESIREHEYQAGQFTQKVFCINDTYWCPYKSKAKDCYGDFFENGKWLKEASSFDPNVSFWRFEFDSGAFP